MFRPVAGVLDDLYNRSTSQSPVLSCPAVTKRRRCAFPMHITVRMRRACRWPSVIHRCRADTSSAAPGGTNSPRAIQRWKAAAAVAVLAGFVLLYAALGSRRLPAGAAYPLEAHGGKPGGLLAARSTEGAAAPRGPRPPHIIVILADDLGHNDLGFSWVPGGTEERLPTPRIDALASRRGSVILEQLYSMPMCTPSRAALMTGLHPTRTGMHHFVLLASQPAGLPLGLTTLPEALRDRFGYRCHAVGKWHLVRRNKERNRATWLLLLKYFFSEPFHLFFFFFSIFFFKLPARASRSSPTCRRDAGSRPSSATRMVPSTTGRTTRTSGSSGAARTLGCPRQGASATTGGGARHLCPAPRSTASTGAASSRGPRSPSWPRTGLRCARPGRPAAGAATTAAAADPAGVAAAATARRCSCTLRRRRRTYTSRGPLRTCTPPSTGRSPPPPGMPVSPRVCLGPAAR